MKQKKRTFSLTAKQRKEQKKKQEQKNIAPENLSEEEKAEILLKKENQKKRNKKLLTIVSLCLVFVIALGLICGGTFLLIRDSIIDNDKVNPTAIITLNNDRKLEIDLLYKEDKAAVANFIYLAEKGFYNDTIFNNTSKNSGFVMMSGFVSATEHRAQNRDYVASLTGFTSQLSNVFDTSNFKLGYRIKKKGSTPMNKRGYFAFLSGSNSNASSSTSFMFITNNNAQLRIDGISSSSIALDPNYTSYIGLLSEETLNVLDEIMNIPTQPCNYVTNWAFPNPEENTAIRIKSIKIKNLNSKLKKNILNNFEEFVLGSSEGSLDGLASTYWRTKQDGYFGVTT